MTTHCRICERLKSVTGLAETVYRGSGYYVRGFLDCGHTANFVTTAKQIADFRSEKALIKQVLE